MRLLRIYPVLVLLTIILGIVCYAAARDQALLGAWAVPTAVLGWWLTETPAGRCLPKAVVNLLLLAAVLWVAGAVYRNEEVRIEDVALFIISIQLIKLFDRKTARDYAQLLSLSQLLVLGSMMMSNELELGLGILAFIPLAVGAVVLHQLYAGREQAAEACRRHAPARDVLYAQAPGAGRKIRRDFVATVAVSTSATFAISALVFVLVPRGVGADMLGAWGRAGVGSRTGFSDHVRLGEETVISESATVVLDLELTDASGRPIGGPDEVYYLRGAALDRYDRGLWRSRSPARIAAVAETLERDERWSPLPQVFEGVGGAVIVQRIRLRNAASADTPLFAIWRPQWVAMNQRGQVYAEIGAGVLHRVRNNGRVEYTVESWVGRRAAPDAPAAVQRSGQGFTSDVVRDLAHQILGEGRPLETAEDVRTAAQLFARHLRLNHRYSLDLEGSAPGRDQIEWFLTEGREGHCEYFASSMAALCRSVGISARLVTGYVAAEYNPTTGSYVVREANAHAWVEVETAPGIWETFDPTPPADLRALHQPKAGLVHRVRQVLDAIEYGWIVLIAGFDDARQQDLLPRLPFDADAIEGQLSRLVQRFRVSGLGMLWPAILRASTVFVGVAICGMAVTRLGRYLARRMRRREARRRIVEADPHLNSVLESVAFYRELEALLAGAGLARPPWRPPLDHAQSIRERAGPLGEAAHRLTELYYSARFARTPLSETASGEVGRLMAMARAEARQSAGARRA